MGRHQRTSGDRRIQLVQTVFDVPSLLLQIIKDMNSFRYNWKLSFIKGVLWAIENGNDMASPFNGEGLCVLIGCKTVCCKLPLGSTIISFILQFLSPSYLSSITFLMRLRHFVTDIHTFFLLCDSAKKVGGIHFSFRATTNSRLTIKFVYSIKGVEWKSTTMVDAILLGHPSKPEWHTKTKRVISRSWFQDAIVLIA